MILKSLQESIRNDVGYDGFVDFGLIICQINGRPIMTGHLNKRFQKILAEIDIRPRGAKDNEQFVFHSLRSTATTYKLRISGGDIKAVQGENGQKDPAMVTKQYSRIQDEDRKRISDNMVPDFYGKNSAPVICIDKDALTEVLHSNPDVVAAILSKVLINSQG
mgnify:CR=1 FL=1